MVVEISQALWHSLDVFKEVIFSSKAILKWPIGKILRIPILSFGEVLVEAEEGWADYAHACGGQPKSAIQYSGSNRRTLSELRLGRLAVCRLSTRV